MASPVPLESLLATIPPENRHQLNGKLEDEIHLFKIAESISDWPTVLPFLPGLKQNDAEAIQHDHILSYPQQRMALLRLWRERNGPWATYRQLAESLHKAGKISAVQTLCEQLGAPANTTPPAPPRTPSQPQKAPPPARQLPEPNMKDLVNMVHTTKPYELGLELNVNENDLDLVRANHKNDLQEQLREVLLLYRRQTVRPSWQQVASALQTIGEIKSAATIAEKYGFVLPQRPGTELPPQGTAIPPAAIPPTTYTATPPPMYTYQYPPPGTYPSYWPPYPGHPYLHPQQPVGGATLPPQQPVQQQWGHLGIAPSGPGVVSSPYLQPPPHPPVATGVHASSAPTTTTPPAAHQPPTQTPVGHEVQKKKRDGRLDLTTLEMFPHFSRKINIMQEVVPRYKQLGNILLKNPNGNRVLAIEMSRSYRVNDVVYEIFQTWLVEDADATWGKLVQCLKDAGLNPLAQNIESCLF